MTGNVKIGNVKITNLEKHSSNDAVYSDGDVENDLLKLFQNGLSDEDRQKILNSNPSWPIRYHLAYERGNLLNWYSFAPGSKILEVGSGCGAITEVLVSNKDVNVVANELSERRAAINAHRNMSAKNLEMVIGNLQDYQPTEKFDYVVCVGVLEYAGTFIQDTKPYHRFLELLGSFLKPGGTLLLAIENRLGMKYLSGAREDHTGGYFDGINNYPQQKQVRTFGRAELQELLEENSFIDPYFYYPHPDYKLPAIVYSDDFLPGRDTTIPKNLFPAPNYDQPRQVLFNEQFFADALERNGTYHHFSNSFLVEVSYSAKKDATKTEKPIFGLTRSRRSEKYRIRTTAYVKRGKTYFRKQALTKAAIAHVNKMAETYEVLRLRVKNSKDVAVVDPVFHDEKTGVIDFRMIKGESVESVLVRALVNEDFDAVTEIIDKYRHALDTFSEPSKKSAQSTSQSKLFGDNLLKTFDYHKVVPSGVLDFNLDNFIVEEGTGKWWLIDYEWRLDTPVPTEFIEYRGLLATLSRYRGMIASRYLKQPVVANEVVAIPKRLFEIGAYTTSKLNAAYRIENTHFQHWVLGRPMKADQLGTYQEVNEAKYFVERSEEKIDEDQAEIKRLKNYVQELEALVYSIEQSNSYRLAKRMLRVRSKIPVQRRKKLQ